jgi:hypothetical protein
MKRCNVLLLKIHIGSVSLLQKYTLFQYHIPLERLYKQNKNGKKESVYVAQSRRSKQKQSPRKNVEDIHEVRVEGRSKGGLVSSTDSSL